MNLTELATRYVNRVGGSPAYARQYHIMTKRINWDVSQLSADRIDDYLTSALDHLSASTVARHRRMLACLFRFAAQERLLNKRTVLRPLRRVKVPPPNPRAWSHADIRSLLAIAAQLPGGTRHCAYATLMPAWILTAYSTGLRRSDLLSLRHDAIRGSKAAIRQDKTGYPHVVLLDAACLAAIRQLPRIGPCVFGGLISAVQVLRVMRKIVKRAGLEGSTKWLRRSGATYCEAAGFDASGHLGHRSPGMKAYYVDRLLLAEIRPDQPRVPPVLSG